MIRRKDDEMWQRIEDVHTPNDAEMRRAEKDLTRVRVVEQQGAPTNRAQSRAPSPTNQPARMRRTALFAMLLLVAAGLGWIGKSIVNEQQYDQLTTADLAILSLSSPDTERSWVSSMSFATKRIHVGLLILQTLAKSGDEAPAVAAAAQQSWDRLRAGTVRTVGDGTYDIDQMLEIALGKKTSEREKLRTIDNIEGLVGRLIPATRTASPARSDTKTIAVWNIQHWLDDASRKPPRYTNDRIKGR